MNNEELLIFNNGERLIPGISHSIEEYTRHKSSYNFFVKKIKENSQDLDVSILDLGCGVGWGCKLLSESLSDARITGLDNNSVVLYYAKREYGHFRIDYGLLDLTNPKQLSILNKFPYDYVVSRGVLEHVDDGLNLIKKVSYNKMLIFDVPYNEPIGDPHHKLLGITEKEFESFENYELYYEDINGTITKEKKNTPNMIMCVVRNK